MFIVVTILFNLWDAYGLVRLRLDLFLEEFMMNTSPSNPTLWIEVDWDGDDIICLVVLDYYCIMLIHLFFIGIDWLMVKPWMMAYEGDWVSLVISTLFFDYDYLWLSYDVALKYMLYQD